MKVIAWWRLSASSLFLCVFLATPGRPQTALPPPSPASSLAERELKQRQDALDRVRDLVANGTLPRGKLDEANEELSDAQDRVTLFRVLFAGSSAQITPAQAASMLEAAHRRVDRQQKVLGEKQRFFEMGIIPRADVDAARTELQDREQVLGLAEGRQKLLLELQSMAESEQAAARDREKSQLAASMIRFPGSGQFQLSQLPGLQAAFLRHFGHALPVSAQGQTAVHQALGLDHSGRVDVALAPESPEGLWFRRFLEARAIPYLAFRSAVLGAATAPHIHVGPGSHRLAAPVTMQEHANR